VEEMRGRVRVYLLWTIQRAHLPPFPSLSPPFFN